MTRLLRLRADPLPPHSPCRPGDLIEEIRALVIHWTEGPALTAREVRHFFVTDEQSAHYVVDHDGRVFALIPDTEVARHIGDVPLTQRAVVNFAWNDPALGHIPAPERFTLAIECCVLDETGRMAPPAERALEDLCVLLCARYNLDERGLYRHHDVTGEMCPRRYVEHPAEWTAFVARVAERLRSGVLPEIASGSYMPRELRPGDLDEIGACNAGGEPNIEGGTIYELQTELYRAGFRAAGRASGCYGLATERAVRQFQTAERLPATGIADAGTLSRLRERRGSFV